MDGLLHVNVPLNPVNETVLPAVLQVAVAPL